MSEDSTTITVEMPKELSRQIEEIANAEHRSKSGQVRFFVEACIREYREKHPSTPTPTPRREPRRG